jgi:hypothetical protein
MADIHITVNGAAVKEFIAQEQAVEVEQVRRVEISDVSFPAHIISKQKPTKSGRSGKVRSVKADERLLAQMFVSGGMTTAELTNELKALTSAMPAEQRKAARYEMAVQESGLTKEQVARLVGMGWTIPMIASRLNGRRLR